jgi:hypothetical protein
MSAVSDRDGILCSAAIGSQCHKPNNRQLFDDLVGAQQNRWGYGKTERLGGLEVQDHLPRAGGGLAMTHPMDAKVFHHGDPVIPSAQLVRPSG